MRKSGTWKEVFSSYQRGYVERKGHLGHSETDLNGWIYQNRKVLYTSHHGATSIQDGIFWVVRDDSGHLFLLPGKRDCVSVSQTQGLTELQCCQGRMKMSRRTLLPDCATVTTLPTYKSNGKPVEQVESKVKPQKVSKQYHVLDSCFLK